jgi:hypothetical protein
MEQNSSINFFASTTVIGMLINEAKEKNDFKPFSPEEAEKLTKRIEAVLEDPVEFSSYLSRVPAEEPDTPEEDQSSYEYSSLDSEDDPDFDWKQARSS